MPSVLHQSALLPFQDDLELAFDLARELFESPLPFGMRVSEHHAALSFGLPAAERLGEVIADLVLCGSHPADMRVQASLIVEAQRLSEKEKRIKFLLYLALTAQRFQRPAWLLVLALGRSVTTWMRNLERDFGGLSFQPLVVDRHTMPRVITERAARQRPAYTLLSALIHGVWGDMEVVETALKAARHLDRATRGTYIRGIVSAVPKDNQPTLKEMLTMDDHERLGEAELNSILYHAEVTGLEKGLKKGLEQGMRKAKLQGLVDQVLLTFELRGLPLDAETAAIIRKCRSIRTLERWRDRAKLAPEPSAIFG